MKNDIEWRRETKLKHGGGTCIGFNPVYETFPVGDMARHLRSKFRMRLNKHGELIVEGKPVNEIHRHDMHCELFYEFGDVDRKVVEMFINQQTEYLKTKN
jgi:hypothetical protein